MSRPFFDRLGEPPRDVPLAVRVYTVFGGCLAQVGWLGLAFGSMFGWFFAGNADVSSLVLFRTGVSRAQGVVTSVRDTHASENRVKVQEVSYRFAGPGGEARSGTSYVTGSPPAQGQVVTVGFVDAMPSVSRIEGMRRATFGPAAAIVLVFPLIGLGLVLFCLRAGLGTRGLLADGRLAAAKLKSKERTNVTVNERPVMKLTFEFLAADGQRYEASESATDTAELEDEPSEQLLYLPDQPRSATLVDGLPKPIQASEEGSFRLEKASAAAVLVLPILTTLGNALAAYLMLFR